MKKPLLLGIIGLTIAALTASTLYAQTVTGTSVIDKMKEAVHAFTLGSSFGQTDLESSPILGKKTGDILTAGEWNRMLELVAQGAGISNVELVTSQAASPSATADYSFRVSQVNCPAGKKVISGGCSYPNTLNTFVHNTPTPDLTGWLCGGLHHDGDTTNNPAKYPNRPTAYAMCGEYGGVGSSGGFGKFEINDTTTKTSYQLTWGGTSWVENSPGAAAIACDGSGATECYQIVTARHDHCVIASVGGTAPHVGLNYAGDKKYTVWNNRYTNQSSGVLVQCYDNIGGGSSGSGSGWVNVPLDAAKFDKSCEYRFQVITPTNKVDDPYMGDDPYHYVSAVDNDRLTWLILRDEYHHINFDSKTIYRVNGVPYTDVTISKLEKFCGGGVSSGGDKFTFLDTEKVLVSSGTTKVSKGTTTLDISTVAGVVIPAGAKAIQVYVQCNNYTTANQATQLFLGKSSTSLFAACQSNSMLSANDVDSNSLIIPLASDGKSIVYQYNVPSADTGGQIAVYLRGFITE